MPRGGWRPPEAADLHIASREPESGWHERGKGTRSNVLRDAPSNLSRINGLGVSRQKLAKLVSVAKPLIIKQLEWGRQAVLSLDCCIYNYESHGELM